VGQEKTVRGDGRIEKGREELVQLGEKVRDFLLTCQTKLLWEQMLLTKILPIVVPAFLIPFSLSVAISSKTGYGNYDANPYEQF